MVVACKQCGARYNVPDDKAANPNLKIKCKCGIVFAIGEGLTGAQAQPPPAVQAAAPQPQPPAAAGPPVMVRCVQCAAPINVPADKAANPQLKIRCRCGALFTLLEAIDESSAGYAPPKQGTPTPADDSAAESSSLAAPSDLAPIRLAPGSTPPPIPGPSVPAGGPVTTGVPRPRLSIPTPAAPAATAPKPAAAAPGALGAAGAPQALPKRPADWRRCVNHFTQRSTYVCPNCRIGYCGECVLNIRNAMACSACDGLCVAASEYEKQLARDRQRQRPMSEEIPLIARYPINDPFAFVLLALFTWFFGLFTGFGIWGLIVGLLFSKGILMAYAFNALSKVSSGEFQNYMPEISDISALVKVLSLGLATFLISGLPLAVAGVLTPLPALLSSRPSAALTLPVAHAQSDEAASSQEPSVPTPPPTPRPMLRERPQPQPAFGQPPGPMPLSEMQPPPQPFQRQPQPTRLIPLLAPLAVLMVIWIVALVWNVVYMPVALTVAAISRSFFSTLNPVLGFQIIARMGSVYWQAVLVYLVISAAQFIVVLPFSFIPILGRLIASFVNAYAMLAIACALGLAVFKKARELGLD